MRLSPFFGRPSIVGLIAAVTLVAPASADPLVKRPQAEWIWDHHCRRPNASAYLYRSFPVGGPCTEARLSAVTDFASAEFRVNGTIVAACDDTGVPVHVDVTSYIQTGRNRLTVNARATDGPAAIGLRLDVTTSPDQRQTVISDARWSTFQPPAASQPGPPTLLHRVATWGTIEPSRLAEADSFAITPFDEYNQWKEALGQVAGGKFQLPPGFQIQRVRQAQAGEDSWVSLACDPQGRWVIAQEKQGLLRLTLSADGQPVRMERINDQLEECRGLLFAFGSLYAHANNSKGLYRLRDTTGDDRFDEVQLLKATEGGVGHGRNDLVLGPDRHIYLIHGDDVIVPDAATTTLPPLAHRNPEDQTATGHVIRTDADGQTWTVIANGLRNPFGIDFHPDGELFTFDADAESEIGLPWYRPTRVYHLVSGTDYGWRKHDIKWPPDAPQSVPANVNIGRGSPTAVKFGRGTNFPAAYRRALFILDWAYGRVFAVHLEPRGASYRGHAEVFLRGRPLNVTDIEFGPDGAMYLLTGGRGTQSALYRVRYVGPPVTEPTKTCQQRARESYARDMRCRRRKLESFHRSQSPRAIKIAWPDLDHPDRWLRNAARVALEHQKVDQWASRALTESQPAKALSALLALARVGPKALLDAVVQRMLELPTDRLSRVDQLIALRIVEIYLARKGQPTVPIRAALIAHFEPEYPTGSERVNRELCELLVALQAPGIIERTLSLVDHADSDPTRLHYLYTLRDLTADWSEERRRAYFLRVADASRFQGDVRMPAILQELRETALANVPENRRQVYAQLCASALAPPPTSIPPRADRPLVRKWSLDDLDTLLADTSSPPNLQQGQEVYAAAQCILCHRLGNRGGSIGPDLTTIARRFDRRDLLTSILDPSAVIPPQYRNVTVTTDDGRSIVGRVLRNDFRNSTLEIATDPFDLRQRAKILKADIQSHAESPLSPMPNGLLNTFSIDEIRDLLAYLESGTSSFADGR